MLKTILVTGGTGYLGSWVVKYLLENDYTVRVTVRDKSKHEKFVHLEEMAHGSPGNLEIFEGDLLKPGSYDEAARGSEAIIHIASPFTLRFKNPVKELIEPAVQGTKNVLSAASAAGSVKTVVLTSSVAAIYGDSIDMQEKGLQEFTEDDFNDTSSETHQPYSYSKLKAELVAWEMARKQESWHLVVMNPAFIMGPPLTASTNSESIQFIKDMLSGKFLPGAPQLEFGFVDVRDVAKAHITALGHDKIEGRHILSERVMNIMSLAKIIRKLYPGKYLLPLMESPKFMLYLVGWAFGLSIKYISRNMNYHIKFNNNKSKKELNIDYTPMATTIRDMIEKMKDLGLVKS
jgi:nucleoside-diphosphate-sugar epimerase